MNYRERIKIFENELNLIRNKEIKELTKACIEAAPDYIFEDCPSSSSGLYHPIDELGADGTILHTKRVVAVAYELSRGLDCENNRDAVCAAAILHDLAKQGLISKGHTVREHPQIMADLIADIYKNSFKDKLDRDQAIMIYYAVRYHYGPWSSGDAKKPLERYTPEELTLYIADYISSKRFVHVEIMKGVIG